MDRSAATINASRDWDSDLISDLLPTTQSRKPFEMPRLTVVMPTLNEAANLPAVFARMPLWVHEIIVVDGHSTDHTPRIARALHPAVRIICESRRGKGAAMRAGFMAATGDIIATIDADGSMDPAELVFFAAALISGGDYAKGSRFIQGGGTSDMSLVRMLGNWGLTQVVRVIHGSAFSDLCYGYNAFWRRHLPHLNFAVDGFEIETALNLSALKAGLHVVEVPSFEKPRLHGVSNLRALPDGLRVLATILREAGRPPVQANLDLAEGERVHGS